MLRIKNMKHTKLRFLALIICTFLALIDTGTSPTLSAGTTITFSEFPVSTFINAQYSPQGVLFSGSGLGPFITTDGANPTSPVLSGSPLFFGSITAIFITPFDPARRALAKNVSFDAGFFCNPGSTTVTWFDINSNVIGSRTNSTTGIEHFVIPGSIGGFTIAITGNEPFGYAIDNVSFEITFSQALRASIIDPPVSGDGAATISGRQFTFQVEAINSSTGNRDTSFNGQVSVNFPAGSTLISGESVSPNPISLNNGVGTAQVVLKAVSDTSTGKDYTLDASQGLSGNGHINIWFSAGMDVERWENCNFTGCPNPGSYICKSACAGAFKQKAEFIALPATHVCHKAVLVRNAAKLVTRPTTIEDVGPTTKNPYWNTGSIPSRAGCITDLLADVLGVKNGCNPGPYGHATILWRFQ